MRIAERLKENCDLLDYLNSDFLINSIYTSNDTLYVEYYRAVPLLYRNLSLRHIELLINKIIPVRDSQIFLGSISEREIIWTTDKIVSSEIQEYNNKIFSMFKNDLNNRKG